MRGYIQWIICCVAVLKAKAADPPPVFDHGVNVDTTRPLVVGHRGFCGAFPDHTLRSYQEAVDHGADVIECDICVTQDLQFVCLHQAWLKSTTDIEEHPEFADRQKTEVVNGTTVTDDWFTPDFTLAELKTLRLKQPFSFRDSSYDGQFQIVTLDEHISVAKNAPRTVAIYPETKDPDWVNTLQIIIDSGKKFEDHVLESLAAHGYTDSRDPCFVQSFSGTGIEYMATKTNLPLVMLYRSSMSGDDITDDLLSHWAPICYGIGVSKRAIVNGYNSANGEKNWIYEVTDLVDRAHAKGLKVHAYTFRNEERYLAWDYMQDPWFEYDKFFGLGVDGFYTDFTPTMVNFLDEKYRVCSVLTTSQTTTTEQSTGGSQSGYFGTTRNFLAVTVSLLLVFSVK